MAVTDTPVADGPQSVRNMDTRVGTLDFTSTTATVELDLGFSKLYGIYFTRIGAVDNDDAGYLSVDETAANGFIDVDADGQITVVRQVLTDDKGTGNGALTTEKFFYVAYGQTL